MNEFLLENKQALYRIKDRFEKNSEGFFEKHKFVITFLIIATFLDAFSTFCFMYVSGAETEFHPVVRFISVYTGPVVGPFLGGFLKIALGLPVIIYIKKFAKGIMLAAALMYSYAFMYNLSVSGAFTLL